MKTMNPRQVREHFVFLVLGIVLMIFASNAEAQNRTAAEWRSHYASNPERFIPQNIVNSPTASYQQRVGACGAGNGTWNPNGGGSCSFPEPQQQQQQADGSMDMPDPRDQENGYGDFSRGVAAPAPAAAPAAQIATSGQQPRDAGAQRAAMCGSPGVTCDDDGNTLYEYDDGSRLLERADGTRTATEATDGAGAAAGGVASAGAGAGAGAARQSLEDLCPEVPAGTKKAPDTPEEATTSACSATKETTETACLMPGPKGMDAGTSAMYTMMMNQMVGLATQIASAGKNMAQQCRLQAQVSTAMAAINGAKATACGVMIGRCNARCDNTALNFKNAGTRYLEIAKANASNPAIAASYETKGNNCLQASRQAMAASRTCNSYQGQVVAMGFGAMQHGLGIVQNKQCEADASAFANQPVPTFSPIALPNPTDCSDPNNQSLACFCSRESNAKSPMCAGFNPGAVAGGGATTNGPGNGIGSSSATPFLGTGDDGAGTDGNTVDPFASKQNASSGDSGFSPGGGSPPGGGSLGSLGGDDGGGGGFGDPRSAITGTSGGQGGGGLGSAGGGGGGGLARNNGSAGGLGGFMDKFNLKKFLPGSKYKTRGIAGMSVKSVDGITGPMGPSIWEKATRQYQEQIQKQNVILDK